jgi:hypothetical protein
VTGEKKRRSLKTVYGYVSMLSPIALLMLYQDGFVSTSTVFPLTAIYESIV